ncbi:hypothetical protein GCM10020358_82990 [Amorphoplanes nipponensis]|uniref:Calx-beta domain-containing protein n=1 Tax=Actinoplanes nipponensis TaxID=135950 RepID=A0A919JE09_9ACTN|nr:Calx-beta domain-containing protein [Actinoplanes nipponensis]GIE47837.1 hypothetical protein Ani05nite_13710 [Actinoplanes nipponensis]
MRYSPAHAAKSGSVPFMLRGPKSLRTAMTAAVAGVVGLVPTVLIASPAQAAVTDGVYSIAAASANEGSPVTFTITRQPPGVGDTLPAETVNWATSDDSATAGVDYTAVTAGSVAGTVSFPAYSNTSVPQTRTITVTTLQDTVDELDAETFNVTLTSSQGSPNTTFTQNGDVAAGTIVDDDNPTYTLVSSPTTVNESTTANLRHATITATLSKTSPYDVTIPLSTKDGTAKAGQDYTAVDDAIVIEAGDTQNSIPVEVDNDSIDEPAIQSFTVEAGAGTNVAGTQTVTVNIADDDAAPVISIASGGTVAEGGTLTFNATLDRQSENVITARWDTADGAVTVDPTHGTAKAGDDYTATTSGTVTFPALSQQPTTPITVKTAFDDVDELTEDLSVKLSQPSNATVDSPSAATGSIIDSGTTPGPQVTLTPTEVVEGGTSATRSRTFTVKLSKPSGREQKVSYSVIAGTADAGAGIGVATAYDDYVPTQGPVNLTFAPGETEKTFTVDIVGDNIDEANGENIAIILGDVNGGLAGGLSLTTNQVTIKDDDDKPVISLARTAITMPETDGPAAALFEVKLSNASAEDIDFTAAPATQAGTADPTGNYPGGDDYDVLAGSGTFTAGQTSAYVLFIVNGDEVYEADETVRYTVARDNGEDDATGGPLTATLTITNDDDAPELEIVSDDVTEGQTVALTGVVTGVAQEQTLLNVTLAGKSMGGKQAASASDFSPAGFQVTVPWGTASGTVVPVGNVVITDDTAGEPAETIVVSGSGFGNTGSVKDGVLTILASDGGSTTPPPGPEVEAPTLKSSSAVRLGRGSVTLSGMAAAGQTVDLWGKNVNAAEYMKLGSTTVASNGMFSFLRGLNTFGMDFKAAIGDMESDPVRVLVREDPDITVASNAKGSVTITVTGDPKVAGLTAKVLQAKTGGGWMTAASGKLSSAGTYTRTITGLTSGKSYTFKAQVLGNTERGIATNYSSYSKNVRVK